MYLPLRLLENSLIIVHRSFSVIFMGTPMHIHNLCDNTALSINARKNYFRLRRRKNRPRFVGCRANLRASKMHSAGNIARQRNPGGQYARNARKSIHRRYADFRVLSSFLCHCLCLPAVSPCAIARRCNGHRVRVLRRNVTILSGSAALAFGSRAPLLQRRCNSRVHI